MQTTTGVSTLRMTISENPAATPSRESFRTTMRKAQETDWDLVIAKADRYISRTGAVALALSALYFASIFISMAWR